jgi:hypothetical protein
VRWIAAARHAVVIEGVAGDVRVAVEWLDGLVAPMPQEKAPARFHH